uniref:Uncharacterized protein n=1 Tax=Trichogramma kaykai TaxID=54128 RepID=A0ABD2WMK5_9HYME
MISQKKKGKNRTKTSKKIKLDEENQAVNENVQDSNIEPLESDISHINLIDSDNGVAYDVELKEDITHKDGIVQATCDVIVKSTQTDLSGSTFKLTDSFNGEQNLKIFTGILSFKILLTLEECISELRKISKKKHCNSFAKRLYFTNIYKTKTKSTIQCFGRSIQNQSCYGKKMFCKDSKRTRLGSEVYLEMSE